MELCRENYRNSTDRISFSNSVKTLLLFFFFVWVRNSHLLLAGGDACYWVIYLVCDRSRRADKYRGFLLLITDCGHRKNFLAVFFFFSIILQTPNTLRIAARKSLYYIYFGLTLTCLSISRFPSRSESGGNGL